MDKNKSRKGLVPVHVDKVKKCLNAIGQQDSSELKKSYVEGGWASVGKYSYRMFLSKISRGGLDYASICHIANRIGNVHPFDLIDSNIEAEWFEQ